MDSPAADRTAVFAITRELLERDGLRRALLEQDPSTPVLDDRDLECSIERTLDERPPAADPRQGLWIFGYGSLPWNPCLDVAETRPATVHGFHRDFCLWETDGRGSPRRPGLTLALAPGGACRAVALRVHPRNLRGELLLLWRREMVTNVYVPRWVRMRTPAGAIDGVAFIANRAHRSHVGRLRDARIARLVATGRGPLGECAEYLERTVAQLHEHGIRDRRLERLRGLVRAHRGDLQA